MVSKCLKRIRKKLREKNQKVISQVVNTPTNDTMNAFVDRTMYGVANYTGERIPSRKKLRNMGSKNNENENLMAGAGNDEPGWVIS